MVQGFWETSDKPALGAGTGGKGMSTTQVRSAGFGEAATPWYLGRYFILSTTLLLVVLAYPLARVWHTDLLRNTVVNAMLISALYAVSDRKWVFRTLGVLLVPILAANWFFDPLAQPFWERLASMAAVSFLVVTTIAALSHVVRSRHVTADLIFGSVAVYLLAGVIVALCFLYLNNLDPGSVVRTVTEADPLGDGSDNYARFLYFSFITLTSVGYGDLAPNGTPARSVALFTGIFGQLYTAILVAKLVGLYTAQVLREGER
jgi:hypothetical protein